MNPPINNILQAIPEIGRIIAEVLARERPPEPPEQEAIRAVFSAIDNTRMYLRKLEVENLYPVPSNPELVELWREASIKIAALNPALAQRLRSKSEYWSDPQGWDQSRIVDAGIGIDLVADDARRLLQLAVPKPQPGLSVNTGADVFISHASEDNETVAEPLANLLKQLGLSVWYDGFSLKLGDRLTDEIDTGLAGCRYGVVILSESFLSKEWTRMELNGLLALETADGRKRVLPIRHGLSQQALALRSPLLAGRIAISTEVGLPAVAEAILTRIRP